MIWENSLFVFIRFICVAIVVMFSGVHIANAASVPVISEDDIGGILTSPLFDGERNTCDPEFWEILKDRAWAEGQREITQNNNIITRPDSVLSMTCFDSFMNHLTNYADNNFPGDPRYANGVMSGLLASALSSFSGEFTRNLVIRFSDTIYNAGGRGNGIASPIDIPNPLAGLNDIDGYLMYAVLELLVLDQLVDNVPSSSARDIMRGLDVIEMISIGNPVKIAAIAACGLTGTSLDYKQYYIEDNFPGSLMGDRASIPVEVGYVDPDGSGPLPLAIVEEILPSTITNQANNNNYACARMNQVWHATKCYDALRESGVFGITPDHDGFYSLQQYRDDSLAGTDYRTREVMCDIPPDDSGLATPDANEIACKIAFHGTPTVLNTTDLTTITSSLVSLYSALVPGTLPTWDTALAGANPAPNAPGAVEQYLHFLGLRDSTDCSSITPIRTGYIVVAPNADQYIDAVCPAPGCFFNPPNNISSNGTCN